MPDPATYRPAPGSIPEAPGVYRFSDVYTMHARTRQMVTSAASVEWTVVSTEVEALQLEYTWIQQFDPRFNVRYRDDKSYP